MKLIKVGLVVFLFTISAHSAVAAPKCDFKMLIHDIGYSLTGSEQQILKSNRWTSLVDGMSEKQIKTWIARQIRRFNNHRLPLHSTPERLAAEIYLASVAYGVDPKIYTKMIEKESQYRIGAVSPTYARGLTQMTSIAREELQHQHGFGRGNRSPGVPAIMKDMASKYFLSETSYNSWIQWVSAPNRDSGRILNTDFGKSLAAGASLLKFYLALKNGSYKYALEQYNGDKVKEIYSRDIRNRAAHDANLICEEVGNYSDRIMAEACFETEDQAACERFIEEEVQDNNNNDSGFDI